MIDTDNHNIVTGAVVGRTRRSVLMRLVIVAVILFAVTTVAIGILLSRSGTTTKSSNKTFSSTPATTTPPVTPASKADALARSGDYAGAQKSLEAEIAKTKDSKEKATLCLSQATIAMNAANYTDAKTYATAADKLTPTSNTAALLGSIAKQTGDKPAARTYYQQAIDRLDKKTAGYNRFLGAYTAHLQELQ